MGPAVVGRGTQKAVDVYEILLAELEERIKNGEGAVEDERHRIYWDGMPVWGRLSAHSKLFSSLNTNVLASTYCNSWIFSALDPEDPFHSMAKAYTELFIVRSDEAKEKYIKEMLEFFKVDGVVYHDAKTCPNNTNCRYGMPQRLVQENRYPQSDHPRRSERPSGCFPMSRPKPMLRPLLNSWKKTGSRMVFSIGCLVSGIIVPTQTRNT